MPPAGYPAVQPTAAADYPAAAAPAYPQAPAPGYPATQTPGYPPAPASGHPATPAPGYPAAPAPVAPTVPAQPGEAATLITSVPGGGRTPASAPTHQVVPSFASAHTAPPASSHGGLELDEDLELTRLRPETPAAPAADDDSIPASALLRISDGRELTITGTVLIGRNPAAGEGEEVGELVRVSDPGRSVSKTHVMIGVDADGVWAADRASTNGTVVTLADGQQIICAEHQVVRLPEGSRVTFGDYSVSFEFRGA